MKVGTYDARYRRMKPARELDSLLTEMEERCRAELVAINRQLRHFLYPTDQVDVGEVQ